MFALAIHPIVRKVEAACKLNVHRWYADDGLIGGEIREVRRALRIIAEEGQKINFLLQPSKTKAYWPTQCDGNLKSLIDDFALDIRPPSEGLTTLGVPLGMHAFTDNFLRENFETIDNAIALAVTIQDGRMAHNIHRVTASACRVTHLLRLIPPSDATARWIDFDNRQSSWFESMSDVPKSEAARRQARLPRAMAGLGLYSAADISPCAYSGSVIDSAYIRADGRKLSASVNQIFSKVATLVTALQPSLAAPADGVLPPTDPKALADLPESSQTILSRAVFHKSLRDALEEDAYRARFVDSPKPPPTDAALNTADWEMLFARRRLLALLRPGANAFLRSRPADEPFCPRELWSVMMRIYLGCYVYSDSSGPDPALCGHCGKHVLDRLGIHAIACCSSGWGRVARHDRLAKLFLQWLAAPAGLAFQGKYFLGEAEGLLFGTGSRPADALVFPPLPGPGEPPDTPTAIDFMVTGPFNTANLSARRAARRAAASSDALLNAAYVFKSNSYRKQVAAAWKQAHPNTPLPGSQPDAPMPIGGLQEVTGFKFRPAVFDTFGGCSAETEDLLMEYAKLVATRQRRSAKGVFNRVYSRLSYCVWSCNAQSVILRRPRVLTTPS